MGQGHQSFAKYLVQSRFHIYKTLQIDVKLGTTFRVHILNKYVDVFRKSLLCRIREKGTRKEI